jgi:hypothetical protein
MQAEQGPSTGNVTPISCGEDRLPAAGYELLASGSRGAAVSGISWCRAPWSLLDDYVFSGFEEQHNAMDGLAREQGFAIASLPTGQWLIVNTV